MGIHMPQPPVPLAAYVPALQVGDWVYVSGQLPIENGRLIATGRVNSQVSLEQACDACRQCALNGLAAIDQLLDGDWQAFNRVVRLGVYVASDVDFTDQSLVADAASQLLVDVLAQHGQHARAAVGVNALPKAAPVEVEILAQVRGATIRV